MLVLACFGLASATYAASDELETMLDAIVAAQMPSGGWTFAHAPGTQPEPLTILVRGAERVLAAGDIHRRWLVLRLPHNNVAA